MYNYIRIYRGGPKCFERRVLEQHWGWGMWGYKGEQTFTQCKHEDLQCMWDGKRGETVTNSENKIF